MGRGRAPCCDKSKVKSGPWSPAEDSKLIDFIQKHGHDNWRALPKLAGLMRCGKSCRLRWINYLRPDVKRGNFTPQEELTIINLHNSFGNKWSKIASYLPGRTDNEIKNVWNTHLKKKKIPAKQKCVLEHSSSPSPTSSSAASAAEENLANAVAPESDFSDYPSKATDDGKIEIPVESDVDFWELMFYSSQNEDSFDPTKTVGVNEEVGWINHGIEWLESELGLTCHDVDGAWPKDHDTIPKTSHQYDGTDMGPETGSGFDYFPLRPSSPQKLDII